jgi:hypothetical protein
VNNLKALSLRVLAWFVFACGGIWTFMMLSAGMGMGFGGRSTLHLVAFLAFGLAMPAVATSYFSLKAVAAATKGHLSLGSRYVLLAVVPIPAFYLLEVELIQSGLPAL